MQRLITIGIIAILIGFCLLLIGTVSMLLKTKKTRAEGGFIFWIGPFPIVGATSKTMFYALLIISVMFLFLFALLNLIGR
jgi:uncharacterized membrane protein